MEQEKNFITASMKLWSTNEGYTIEISQGISLQEDQDRREAAISLNGEVLAQAEDLKALVLEKLPPTPEPLKPFPASQPYPAAPQGSGVNGSATVPLCPVCGSPTKFKASKNPAYPDKFVCLQAKWSNSTGSWINTGCTGEVSA